MKFFLLINIKMPTIVGILIFISRKNFMLNWIEYEKILWPRKEVTANSTTIRCTTYSCNIILTSMALGVAIIRWYVSGIHERSALYCTVQNSAPTEIIESHIADWCPKLYHITNAFYFCLFVCLFSQVFKLVQKNNTVLMALFLQLNFWTEIMKK